MALAVIGMWSRAVPELADALAPLATERELMLKRVEAVVTPFLVARLRQVATAEGEAAARGYVARLEETFQAQRAEVEGLAVMRLVFDRFAESGAAAPRTIWVAGCGNSWEAVWIQARFPAARTLFLDIAPAAVAATAQRLVTLGMANAEARVADLTQDADLPSEAPELILYVHPYVIGQGDYEALAQKLGSGKSLEAAGVEPSLTARAIFAGLWERLRPGGTLLVATLEEAEKVVVEGLFSGRTGAKLETYHNQFAVKTVASLLAGRTVKAIEPRSYHYLVVVRK